MLLTLQNSLWAQAETEAQFQLKSTPKSAPIPNCTRITSQLRVLRTKPKARRAGILSSMESMGKGLDTWTDVLGRSGSFLYSIVNYGGGGEFSKGYPVE